MNEKHLVNRQDGMALVVSLLLMLVIVLLGTGLAVSSRGATRVSVSFRAQQEAFQAADGGLEHAREALRARRAQNRWTSWTPALDAARQDPATRTWGTLVDAARLSGFGRTTGLENATTNTPVLAPFRLGPATYQVFVTNDPDEGVTTAEDRNDRFLLTSFASGPNGVGFAAVQALYRVLDLGGLPELPGLINLPGPDVAFHSAVSAPFEVNGDGGAPDCWATVSVTSGIAQDRVRAQVVGPGSGGNGSAGNPGSGNPGNPGGGSSGNGNAGSANSGNGNTGNGNSGNGGSATGNAGGGNRGNGGSGSSGNGTSTGHGNGGNPHADNYRTCHPYGGTLSGPDTVENFINTNSSSGGDPNANPYDSATNDPLLHETRTTPDIIQVDYLAQLVHNLRAAADYVGTTYDASAFGRIGDPRLVVVEGDLALPGNASHAGILVVTGELTLNGGAEYAGVIYAIGAGSVVRNGAGNAVIDGMILAANTNEPWAEDPRYVGVPSYRHNGGGVSFHSPNAFAGSGDLYRLSRPLERLSFSQLR